MIQIQLQTDVGLKRKQNEDFVSQFVNQNQESLVVLADGIGGNKSGDVASRLVVNKLGLAFSVTDFSTASHEQIEMWFTNKLTELNAELRAKGAEDAQFEEMGTTIVLIYIHQNETLVAHVGDSRAYIFKDNHLHLLTEDHTFVNALYKLDSITKEEAETHPERHKLIRAIGVPIKEQIEVDYLWQQLQVNNLYLLCSDGLTNMLSDQIIEETLKTTTNLTDLANSLVEQAKAAGGYDNISVALIRNEEVQK